MKQEGPDHKRKARLALWKDIETSADCRGHGQERRAKIQHRQQRSQLRRCGEREDNQPTASLIYANAFKCLDDILCTQNPPVFTWERTPKTGSFILCFVEQATKWGLLHVATQLQSTSVFFSPSLPSSLSPTLLLFLSLSLLINVIWQWRHRVYNSYQTFLKEGTLILILHRQLGG